MKKIEAIIQPHKLEDAKEALKNIGVDQFSIYLQHDDKDHTLQVYGEKVMPAVAETVKAKA